MGVVALEEHFTAPALARRIDPGAISRRDFRPRKAPKGPNPLALLPEIGEQHCSRWTRPTASGSCVLAAMVSYLPNYC